MHQRTRVLTLILFYFFRNSEMILKFLKMGNISRDVIPHHINLSAVTVEDYHLVYDIIQKVKEEEFAVLHLNSCQIEDELNKVSKPCLSSQAIIVQLTYSSPQSGLQNALGMQFRNSQIALHLIECVYLQRSSLKSSPIAWVTLLYTLITSKWMALLEWRLIRMHILVQNWMQNLNFDSWDFDEWMNDNFGYFGSSVQQILVISFS